MFAELSTVNLKALADIVRLNDCGAARDSIVQFVRQRVGDKPVLVGLSGGIDSALTCRLAVDALGACRVRALIVRNQRYSDSDLAASRRLAEELGVTTQEIDATTLQLVLLPIVALPNADTRKTSALDARITDLLLRTLADRDGCLYLGTINATERLTGWYPKGALVGDFNPIGGLLKHQVQELAAWYDLPQAVVMSVSADASRICSGCGELPEFRGIPYLALDAVLAWYEAGGSDVAYAQASAYGVAPEMVRTILDRVAFALHKQTLFAPYLKVQN